jgi:hypothetical protein
MIFASCRVLTDAMFAETRCSSPSCCPSSASDFGGGALSISRGWCGGGASVAALLLTALAQALRVLVLFDGRRCPAPGGALQILWSCP